MSFIGREMALPMEQIIGGPLQAIVKAQSLAANTTAEFITTVGLETVSGVTKARTVGFSFDRKKIGETGTETTETVNLNVPLLTIIPIPFIRVEEATIDFSCTVASSNIDTSKSNFGINASVSGGFWGVKASLNTSFSMESTHKSEVTRTATLKVQVKAVQDKVPAGLEKILEILQTAITDGTGTAAATP
ncbi:MAG TPA: DUF2589 domain-containing protein [Fibrobacteria bacterium]|nr:DUF2589 domain-containing protein [Fibrobacteria bacterium]HOX51287.1 DUF2589 domain-containing protein [Fibrobacteria bacterium]